MDMGLLSEMGVEVVLLRKNKGFRIKWGSWEKWVSERESCIEIEYSS